MVFQLRTILLEDISTLLMSARQWNGLVEEMLTLIFEMHSPKWFIFDGAFPYRGMLNAIQASAKYEEILDV